MSRNKARDTKPEMLLRKIAWKQGLRYRLNYKLEGKPDLVFVKYRLAVFVDGCFWHGCPEHYKSPKTRAEFWQEKIQRNRRRDRHVNRVLAMQGWHVLRFWEHSVRASPTSCVEIILEHIRKGELNFGLEEHSPWF